MWTLLLLSCATPPGPAGAAEPPTEVVLHRAEGPLAGMVVYLSAGHGRLLARGSSGNVIAWSYQRDERYGVREDLWTASFVIDHLAPTLEAAGATVLTLRERDRGEVGARVDDADGGFEIEGNARWEPDTLAWGPGARIVEDTGRATWKIVAPTTGKHRIYARWVSGPDRAPEARYTVTTSGRSDVWFVDQRVHSGIWWPLGEVALVEGEVATVTLDGAGGLLSADAVRLGGGLASPGPAYEATPLWQVAPIHRYDTLGGPFELLWLPDGAESSDIRFRARWASWDSPRPEDAVYLSIHTNAGHGRGTEIYAGVEKNPVMDVTPSSAALTEALHLALTDATHTILPDWIVEPPARGDFSEISPKWQQLPSSLVEVGFHDSPADTVALKDPAFRQAFAEGMRDALVRFRANRPPLEPLPPPPEHSGPEADFPPEPPPITEGSPPPDNPEGQ